MIEFIYTLLVASGWIWGVHCLFSEGYLLHPLAKSLEQNGLPKWISKPLYGCPPCMSSFHGILIGSLYLGLTPGVITFSICLCGINFILKNIIYPEYE